MEKQTIKQLQETLKSMGLPISGSKQVLINRINEGPIKNSKEKKTIFNKYFSKIPELKYNPLTIKELKDLLQLRGQSITGKNQKVLIKRLVEKDKFDFKKKLCSSVAKIENLYIEYRSKKYFYESNVQNNSAQQIIARNWKKYSNKTLEIVKIIQQNTKVLQSFHFIIRKILIENPPAKNENKFIYGKLIENAVFELVKKCCLKCIDLDEKKSVGSEFKNDCIIQDQKVSIKTLKNFNDIVLINKNSNSKTYSIKTNYLLCVIEEEKLFFFPSFLFKESNFIVDNESNITMKRNIFDYLEEKYSKYIISLPKLTRQQKFKLNSFTEKNRIKEIFEKEYSF